MFRAYSAILIKSSVHNNDIRYTDKYRRKGSCAIKNTVKCYETFSTLILIHLKSTHTYVTLKNQFEMPQRPKILKTFLDEKISIADMSLIRYVLERIMTGNQSKQQKFNFQNLLQNSF